MLRLFGTIGNNVPSDKPNDNFYDNYKDWKDVYYRISTCGLDSVNNFFTEEGGSIVVVQGNLFESANHKKPANYILDLYNKKQDISFVRQLNGSFNFFLIDKRNRLIYLATDKCGSRPLFVYQKDNQLTFGSEIKLLLSLLNKHPAINWGAWGEYLTFRFTLGENTFYKDIRLIPNGTLFKISYGDKTKISEEQYWDFPEIETDLDSSFEQKIHEGTEIFKTIFQSLGDDIKDSINIVALSGGYDSRSIVSGLKKFSPSSKFDTVTTLHPAGSEKEIVNELSEALKLKNKYIDRPTNIYKRFFIRKAYLSDCLVQEHLWTMPMLDTISQYNTYIDGIAGDIVMRSTRVRPIHIEKKDDTHFLVKLFKKQFGFDYIWLEDYIDPNIWNHIKFTDDWTSRELSKIPTTENRMMTFLIKNRVRNGISIAPNNIIGNNVKMVIQPFFDDRLVRFGFSIPHKYKFKFIYREILNAAFPEIMSIPSTSDENTDKLKSYDNRILQFDQNPRELISDYSDISKEDTKYLFNLLRQLDFPSFINKQVFIDDMQIDLKVNRINTILDIVLWYNMFEQNNLPI